MKKYLTILAVMMFVETALAGNNSFCKNYDSSDDYCVEAANVMYRGYMEGFAKTTKKHIQEDNFDANLALEQARELIPYDIFYSAFQTCGEAETNIYRAQSCVLKELQKYVLSKSAK